MCIDLYVIMPSSCIRCDLEVEQNWPPKQMKEWLLSAPAWNQHSPMDSSPDLQTEA